MDSKNINIDFLLAEIKSLKESQNNLESRIQELEGQISNEGFKLIPNLNKSIHLYIDIEEVILERIENHSNNFLSLKHKFRDGSLEFLYWCIENFNCYWLTNFSKMYWEYLIKESNAEPLLQIEHIDLSDKRSKPSAIDKYKDFYWLTTHKGNSTINDMRDDYYSGFRKLSIKQLPINEIKKILFEILYKRAAVKFNGIGRSRPKGIDWGDGSYSGGGEVNFIFEKEDKFRLVLETRESYLFHIYWRLHISKNNETLDILESKSLEEFIYHLQSKSLSILRKLNEEEYEEFL